ncbi:hypothetical protein, partial [Ancylobacter terrae]|uniref:hypothetical protein n=1 Tax=Ancylobacter sp. sgz301288 TaxID=3342077 RepID=UPI0038589775
MAKEQRKRKRHTFKAGDIFTIPINPATCDLVDGSITRVGQVLDETVCTFDSVLCAFFPAYGLCRASPRRGVFLPTREGVCGGSVALRRRFHLPADERARDTRSHCPPAHVKTPPGAVGSGGVSGWRCEEAFVRCPWQAWQRPTL